MDPELNLEDDDEKEMRDEKATEEEKKMFEEEKEREEQRIQTIATEKQKKRTAVMGELLRSKGFFWNATTNVSLDTFQSLCYNLTTRYSGHYRRLAAGRQRAARGGGAALDVPHAAVLGGDQVGAPRAPRHGDPGRRGVRVQGRASNEHFVKITQSCTITEKAPTRAFSWFHINMLSRCEIGTLSKSH